MKSFVLQILCLKVGKVIRAKIFTARARKDVCYGFVTMADPETAQKCVAELNKTKMPDGNLITVEKVLTRKIRMVTVICISNYHFST